MQCRRCRKVGASEHASEGLPASIARCPATLIMINGIKGRVAQGCLPCGPVPTRRPKRGHRSRGPL
jgi:hypothetical protein